MDSKVSIIIPAYNAEQGIVRCINSLINQTYINIEIIIINDGSIDGTDTLCCELLKIDNRIKYVKQTNKGVSFARNKGIELSTGDFILFVDSDDWLEKSALTILMEKQQINDYDIVMFGYLTDNCKKKTKTSQINDSFYSNELEVKKAIPTLIQSERINQPWGKLYKARLFEEIKFDTSLNIGEDALLNYYVFFRINSLYILNRNFYNYSLSNDNSLTKKLNPKKAEMLTYINNSLNEIVSQNGNSKELLNASEYIKIKGIYSCLTDILKHYPNHRFSEKKNLMSLVLSEMGIPINNYRGSDKLFRILDMILRTNNINIIYAVTLIIYKIKS